MTGEGSHQAIVLVVERDAGVAELARRYLAREGHAVHVEAEPVRASDTARRLRPDVIVLDLAVSGQEEPAGAQPVYAQPVVYVLPDGVAAPGPYAVARPFSPRVLVAEVARALHGGEPAPPEGVLEAGDVTLDLAARTVSVAGGPCSLTATEFDLLAFLMASPGRVYNRDQLLVAVWGSPGSAGPRTVDVHIAQLRAKLGGGPIRTVRGVGYTADA